MSTNKQLRLAELSVGEIGYDPQRKQYWVCKQELWYHNELGVQVYPKDYDALVTVLPELPRLLEGDVFVLKSYSGAGMPHEMMIFEIVANFFRLRIRCQDYRITLPFWFPTQDQRVPLACAEWSCKGKIIDEIRRAVSLQLTYEDRPKLVLVRPNFQTIIVPRQ